MTFYSDYGPEARPQIAAFAGGRKESANLYGFADSTILSEVLARQLPSRGGGTRVPSESSIGQGQTACAQLDQECERGSLAFLSIVVPVLRPI